MKKSYPSNTRMLAFVILYVLLCMALAAIIGSALYVFRCQLVGC